MSIRIGMVLITRWWRGSIDHDGYAAAIKKLGCEPVMVCRGDDAGDAAFSVVVASASQQESTTFWSGLRLDAAIVWNWMRGPAMITAMGQAGIRTLLRADSDGIVSDCVFPLQRLAVTLGNGATLRNKLGLLRHFLLQALPSAKARDVELLSTIRAADAVAVETETARQNLLRVSHACGEGGLPEKLQVVPHSVPDELLHHAPGTALEKGDRIFCGGRWDAPQKDVALLCRVVSRVLAAHPTCRFTICGPINLEERCALSALGGRVECLGPLSRSEVIRHLGESRIILSTSRWETQPIGALEALCMGCTVVAPPIPGFLDMVEGGDFGTLGRRRTAAALAEACLQELGHWEHGRRDPGRIAMEWRSRVSNERVVASLLARLGTAVPLQAEARAA